LNKYMTWTSNVKRQYASLDELNKSCDAAATRLAPTPRPTDPAPRPPGDDPMDELDVENIDWTRVDDDDDGDAKSVAARTAASAAAEASEGFCPLGSWVPSTLSEAKPCLSAHGLASVLDARVIAPRYVQAALCPDPACQRPLLRCDETGLSGCPYCGETQPVFDDLTDVGASAKVAYAHAYAERCRVRDSAAQPATKGKPRATKRKGAAAAEKTSKTKKKKKRDTAAPPPPEDEEEDDADEEEPKPGGQARRPPPLAPPTAAHGTTGDCDTPPPLENVTPRKSVPPAALAPRVLSMSPEDGRPPPSDPEDDGGLESLEFLCRQFADAAPGSELSGEIRRAITRERERRPLKVAARLTVPECCQILTAAGLFERWKDRLVHIVCAYNRVRVPLMPAPVQASLIDRWRLARRAFDRLDLPPVKSRLLFNELCRLEGVHQFTVYFSGLRPSAAPNTAWAAWCRVMRECGWSYPPGCQQQFWYKAFCAEQKEIAP